MDNEPVPPASVEPAAPTEIFLAGFWVRAGALIVDTLILALTALLPVQGLSFLVALAYKTVFISQGGQTPGKMASGIKVLTASGEPVGIGRALGRALAEYLSGLTLAIGYIAAASPDKRALHDYVAGTRVIYVDGVGRGRKAAFAALGVLGLAVPLAAIAAMAYSGIGGFGKYKELITKSGEGATKGNLGALRSGLAIYYGDAEGQYPATLDALIPRHIQAVPKVKTANHPETVAWIPYGAEVCTGSTEYGSEIDASKLKDAGGWGYVTDPQAKCYGQVFVDCTHADTKGKLWPSY